MSQRAIRKITGILAIAILASTAWGLSMCLGRTPIVWGMFGFETIVVLSGILAALFALGRFPDAPALTLVIVAGTVFISAGLGLVALGMSPRAVLMHPLFLIRFAIVGALTLLAAFAALGSNRTAWRILVRGVVLSAASAALLAIGLATRGSWLSGTGALQVVLIVAGTMGAIVLLALLCIGAHLVIRAFEVALAPSPESDTKGSSPNTQEAL